MIESLIVVIFILNTVFHWHYYRWNFFAQNYDKPLIYHHTPYVTILLLIGKLLLFIPILIYFQWYIVLIPFIFFQILKLFAYFQSINFTKKMNIEIAKSDNDIKEAKTMAYFGINMLVKENLLSIIIL
jgi:hypothetical protein